MMKKTVSLLMAATLAVGMLAGCGGQKSAETSASAAGASEPAAVEEPEKNESTNYKKEIRIGLGVPLPTPEWGALLSASKSFIINAQHMCLFPGLAIMITVMVINLVGDGLRDALDPKLKR